VGSEALKFFVRTSFCGLLFSAWASLSESVRESIRISTGSHNGRDDSMTA
jgi:hypothetical protein